MERTRELQSRLGEGEAVYLARLDAVDQEGFGVPMTPPSAHDALKGRGKNRNKSKDACQ